VPEFNLRDTRRAVFKSRLRPNERLLVLAVLDHWSKRRPVPFPGIARLVKWTGLSRQTVVTLIAGLFDKGVFPDLRPRDVDGNLVKTTKPLRFDLSELVQRLDQLLVQPLDQRRKTHWSNPRQQLVYSSTSTGLALGPIQHQNGSSSPEVSNEVSSEESKWPSSKNDEAVSVKPKARSKAIRTPEQRAAHQRITSFYFEAFRKIRERDPVIGKPEGQAVYDLLSKLNWNEVEATRRIELGLSSWAQATIRTIASDPDRIADGPPVKKTTGPKQPNGGTYQPRVV
jgi:hypothetical protein